jgi:tungstate transport system substrate-binding protein
LKDSCKLLLCGYRRHGLQPATKQELARPLADWLASPDGQAAIGAYQVNGEQLFHPSAAAPK